MVMGSKRGDGQVGGAEDERDLGAPGDDRLGPPFDQPAGDPDDGRPRAPRLDARLDAVCPVDRVHEP